MYLTIDATRAQLAALRRVFQADHASAAWSLKDTHVEDLHLMLLAATETDAVRAKPHTGQCRRCGCVDVSPCLQGCGWVDTNLCSTCLTPSERRRYGRTTGR